MKVKSKKLLSALLAVMMVFGLFAAMPAIASASNVAELIQQINNFDPGPGSSGSLAANTTGSAIIGANTVIVTGNVTGAVNKLTLDIGEGIFAGSYIKVLWQAEYSGDVNTAMIELTGPGTFEVAAGSIVNNGSGNTIVSTGVNATINVNHISKVIAGQGNAIRIEGQSSTVKVSDGGGVFSRGDAICAIGSDAVITVGGGQSLVRSEGSGSGSAIYIADTSANSSVTVFGGGYVNTDTTVGYNHAICSEGAGTIVKVFGHLSTKGEYATISMRGTNPTVEVTGGYVFGIGTDLTGERNVIYMSSGSPTYSGGVVCVWNMPSETPTYVEGSSTDLKVNAGVTATWMLDGTFSYIACKTKTQGTYMIDMGNSVNVTVPPSISPPISPGMSNFTASRNYTPGQFPDVDEDMWYGCNGLGFIATAFEYGLVNGYEDGNFGPTDTFTVAQAIALAARINSIYATGADLQQGEPWYKVFVDYALANDIIQANDFPDIHRPATRAEMAYIFANCLPVNEFESRNTVNSLPDVTASTPYRDSIFLLYRAGVISGNDAAGTFTPNSNMDRAMAAGIASKIILPLTRDQNKVYGSP